MESMSIGQVASRAGVRPSALRYYEGVGLLPPPERENGRRCYDGEVLREVLDRLAVVRVAQQAGFTISEIRTLLDGFSEDTPPSERWRVLAEEKIPGGRGAGRARPRHEGPFGARVALRVLTPGGVRFGRQ